MPITRRIDLLLSCGQMGAVGNTTPTDPRSRRNRVGRRGGQLLTRTLGSSSKSACPLDALPVPLVPDGRTIRQDHQDSSPIISAEIFIPDTNAIEALNSKLRRAVRARGHFPTDEAAMKLLFLVLNRSEKEWTMPAREWSLAKAQFAIFFGERFTRAMA